MKTLLHPLYAFLSTLSPFPRIIKPASVLAIACISSGAGAADWYVDGKAGYDNNTGSASAPFLHIWRAWQAAQPGDTIHVLPTVVYGPQYFSGKSGTASQYITIQGEGASPNLTQISGNGTNFALMLDTNVNYVRIQNLDVTAPGHGTYSGWSGFYVKQSHHVEILGNYVHDSGCSGIQFHHSDYATVRANRVANNAKVTYNNVFCSGISQHENLDIDTNTGIKMVVSNNIVYDNTNVPDASCIAPCLDSDGNGIIIDDSRRTQTDYKAYKGGTLIENNIVFNNGGRGVAVYLSDNVLVRSNTFYQNNKDPNEGSWRPGEIGISYSGSTSAYNNIFYSDGKAGTTYTGAHVAISVEDCTTGGPVNVDYNLSFNPQNDRTLEVFMRNNAVPVAIGSNNKWADPLFAVPSLDPALANFQILSASPALGFLSPAGSYAPTDYLGVLRTSPVTAGAYQTALGSATTTTTSTTTTTTTTTTTSKPVRSKRR